MIEHPVEAVRCAREVVPAIVNRQAEYNAILKDGVLPRAVNFLTPLLKQKFQSKSKTPFFIGIEGPQGSGKTTVSRSLTEILSKDFPSFEFVTFSMDDFYLTHEQQNKVAAENPDNKLLNGRGLPGTQDVDLLLECLHKLNTDRTNVDIPQYDKSQHNGQGDREPEENWIHIREPKKIDVVIFEGWFNGYPSYRFDKELELKWDLLKAEGKVDATGIEYAHIQKLNSDLQKFQHVWDYFNAFVCITTDSLRNVYVWRLEQEHNMIKAKGSGMTDEEVEKFVDRYMPAYQLYFDRLSVTCSKTPSLVVEIDLERQPIN